MKRASLFFVAFCLTTASVASPVRLSRLSEAVSRVLPWSIILPNAPQYPRRITEQDYGLHLICVPGDTPGETFSYLPINDLFVRLHGLPQFMYCSDGEFTISQ